MIITCLNRENSSENYYPHLHTFEVDENQFHFVSNNKSSKDSQSMKEMSPEAQKLYKRLIELSKTTKVRPKIISNNDVYQFIDLERTS